jgi:hypothetical protein
MEATEAASTPSADARARNGLKSTPGTKSTTVPSPPTSAAKGIKATATHLSPAPVGAVDATAPTKRKDTLWLLEHLKPSTPLAEREEASRELKHRIKAAEDVYWLQNYAQVRKTNSTHAKFTIRFVHNRAKLLIICLLSVRNRAAGVPAGLRAGRWECRIRYTAGRVRAPGDVGQVAAAARQVPRQPPQGKKALLFWPGACRPEHLQGAHCMFLCTRI